MSRTSLAKWIRQLGGSRLVDSPRLRRAIGAPLYARHRLTARPDDGGTSVSGPAARGPRRASGRSSQMALPTPPVAKRPAVANPALSVIVPVYNVEEFVTQALRSVLDQSFEDLEVVVVDDGSSDGSLDLVRALASADGRIHVVVQENAGLGAARNAGVAVSTAPYITFMDSDDVVLPGAFERMMSVIQESGSDVVIGGVERTDGRKTWQPQWVSLCHDEDRVGITAAELPAILWDVYAWNKIYRRESWDRYVGAVPEGILYEDQECSGKLYTAGAKLDILSQNVYQWRLRTDGTSITQQKTSLKDLRDRLTVISRMQELLDAANQDLRDYWYTKVLEDDLYWYYLAVPRADDEFYSVLAEGAKRVYAAAPTHALRKVSLYRRLLTLAIVKGERRDFEQVLVYAEENRRAVQLRVTKTGRLIADSPVLGELGFSVQEADLDYTDMPLDPIATVRGFSNREDGSVVLEGDVYVAGFATDGDVPGLDAQLVVLDREGRVTATLRADIEGGMISAAARQVPDPLNDYTRSGFALTIPAPAALLESVEAVQGPLEFVPVVSIQLPHGRVVETRLKRKDVRGAAGRLRASAIDDAGWRTIPKTLEGGDLAFELTQVSVIARDLRTRPHGVELGLEFVEAAWRGDLSQPIVVRAKNSSTGASVEAHAHVSEGRASVTLHFMGTGAAPTKNWEDWDITVAHPGGNPRAVAYFREHERELDAAKSRFMPVSTGYGFLRLRQNFQYGEVFSVEVTREGTCLEIQGAFHIDPSVRTQTPTFALVSSTGVLHPAESRVEFDKGRFLTRFCLQRLDVDGRPVSVGVGDFIFQLLSASRQSLPASSWFGVHPALTHEFPLTLPASGVHVTLTRTRDAGGLSVHLRAPLREDEVGAYNQRRAMVRRSTTRGALRDAVLFESFAGNAVQDSPVALDRVLAQKYPDLPRYWTVRDGSVAVPQGSVPLVMYSEEWFDVVAHAKWLVNNNNFPYWFRRHPDQVYVQTWHGTPLKRIGNHVPPQHLSLSYRALMRREAEQYWSYLLAQTPWAGTVLREAFGYGGTVLDQGYPRNDILVRSPRSEARRTLVREHFGVGPHQRVVLYAPTWRDTSRDAAGRYRADIFLDTSKLASVMGNDGLILVRGHTNTRAGQKDRVQQALDVTNYPDINDLILAADVLVTDYSSVMFDFVVTGKPVVFLAPDLVEYRDKTRGFYFDFEAVAPGPICSTSDEAVDAVQAASRGELLGGENYRDFADRFAGLDDGLAAERVVSEVWQF